MKKENVILAIIGLGFLAILAADRLVLVRYQRTFEELQKQSITTANKLATAKILHENLNHVRELVFENMDFAGQRDTVPHQQRFFEFLTNCVNDLKMELVAVEPARPETKGRIETDAYNVELEGDFFSVGEFCAKLENSRRISTVESFEMRSSEKSGNGRGGHGLRLKMRINTYRVRK
jgi:Tfp pilus assembly protein PilO